MKHLMLTAEEKSGHTPSAPAESKPEYPSGMQIHLTEHELGKLGMKELPEPGTHLTAAVKLHVTGAMIHDGPDGTHKMVHMQITHMSVGGEKEGHEETSGEVKRTKLYDTR